MTRFGHLAVAIPSSSQFSSRVVESVHLSYWHDAATDSGVQQLQSELERLIEQQPRISVVLVVPNGTPLSGDAARKSAVEMLDRLGTSIQRVGIAIEGGGFFVAAIRMMFSGIALLARPRFEWRIFRSREELGPWLVDADACSTLQQVSTALAELTESNAVTREG